MILFLKRRFLNPLKEFIHDSRAIGIILLSCTVVSMILANLGHFGESYINFWENHFDGTKSHHLHIGFLSLPNSLLLIINDAFMAIFFFLAGLEIKRELKMGELSSIKKAVLPIAGALGGMLVPAVIYMLINKGTPEAHGWGIPMATDIAFSLGVASLLGNRVPFALKVFLTALAIIDDLGAIVVIALFYGDSIHWGYFAGAASAIGFLYLLNNRQISLGIWHALFGAILWYCTFNSGIHATIAGVIFAFMIPIKYIKRLEMALHNWVYFFVMPIFAMANTAIPVSSEAAAGVMNSKVSWGIMLGLFLGKPLGIYAACKILVQAKLADLPKNSNWYGLIGAGILAGIGFTMSIFIATLAFKDVTTQNIAKMAVLLASITAIIVAILWLNRNKPIKPELISDDE